MNTHADKTQENKSHSVANWFSQKQSSGQSTFQFVDNRPEAIAQKKLQEVANNSLQVKQMKAFQEMANNRPQVKQAAQLQVLADNYSVLRQQPIQKKENNTGLPDNLKSGIENLTGYSMDDVKVHHNSDKPAQLNAHAYAQGTDIHLGSGQEKHLPHEVWHVVQQKQGRVKPMMQMKGEVNVNNDAGLEQEADMMGAKAMQTKSELETKNINIPTSSDGLSIQTQSDNTKVSQFVLATVNPQNGPVNLQQAGGAPAFVIMQNPTQVNGNDVNNTVGFTGVLNAADWANLGKSPADYWRAHAYANSFGGAGDVTNVGWWKADSEATWTENEQKVRGAGLAQIPAWLPGTGETGTYNVTRTMHPAIAFKNRYVADLMKAVNWGLDDGRAAWTRAIATCDTLYPVKKRLKRIAQLNQMKVVIVAAANGRIQAWVDSLFGTSPLETNLIKSMTMTYAITNAGLNPGASRQAFSKKIDSAKPNIIKFGLKNEPQNIWIELVNSNVGVFAQGNSPTAAMVRRVAYDDVHKPAQEFRAYADGWGVRL